MSQTWSSLLGGLVWVYDGEGMDEDDWLSKHQSNLLYFGFISY